MAVPADAMGQAFQAAAINAQLIALPIFSDNVKEDKLTAKQWLEKVIINKTGGNWNDAQTLTHFRNALRGDMVGWYTSIAVFDDTELTWELLKTKFERDFQAAPATSKVIGKLTEIRQQDHENVNKYLSRCGVILADLKEKVSVEAQDFNLDLTPQALAAWNGLHADMRAELSLQFKRTTTKKVFSQMAGFHIIAGFKATIRSILMEKEDQLTTLDLIKAEALKIERRLEEKQRTSTNGDGSSRVLNTNQINHISNPTQSEDEIDAIGRRNFNTSRNQNTRGNIPRCSHCNKPGHKVEDCWKKHGKPNNNASSSTHSDNNATNKKKCTYCGMTNHTTDKCYKLQRDVKNIERAKNDTKINKVDHNNSDDEDSHNSKN